MIFLRQPTILRAVLLSVRRAASVFIHGATLPFHCAAWLFVRRAAVECSFVELLLECSFVELKGRSSAELLECSSVKLLDVRSSNFLQSFQVSFSFSIASEVNRFDKATFMT